MEKYRDIGIHESEIPKDVIQNCPDCLCIPASIFFILRCHNSKIEVFQENLYRNGMDFEKACRLEIPEFLIDYKGFSLEEYSNNRQYQFDKWKDFIIDQLIQKKPVAVCFKSNEKVHCKVIFQYCNDSFKVFNPGSENILDSIVVYETIITEMCKVCNSDTTGLHYYSTIETYSLKQAYQDLLDDILQMQVLCIHKL